MKIQLIGIKSPDINSDETRDIVHVMVEHPTTKQTYIWSVYRDQSIPLDVFLATCQETIKSEIDYKEAIWKVSKTEKKKISDENGIEKEVPIEKIEIVKPEIPDYYALRRKEYPSLAEQIGALINPDATPSLDEVRTKVLDVKLKYPKPAWLQNNK